MEKMRFEGKVVIVTGASSGSYGFWGAAEDGRAIFSG